MSFDRMDCYLISDHYLDPRLRTRSYLRLFFGSLSEIEIGIQSEKKTQIANSELDADLNTDGDPIYKTFLNAPAGGFQLVCCARIFE